MLLDDICITFDIRYIHNEQNPFFVRYWYHLADKLSIHSLPHLAGFYKPTTPQYPPSHLQDYSTHSSARFIFSPAVSFHALIQVH